MKTKVRMSLVRILAVSLFGSALAYTGLSRAEAAPRTHVEVMGMAQPESLESVQIVGLESIRAAAIHDALVKAVEWALRREGVIPKGSTYGRGGTLSAARLAEQVPKYIEDYEVLETTSNDSLATARVRVLLNEIPLEASGLGRLRILPLIAVHSESERMKVLPSELRSALVDHLTSSGLRILEPDSAVTFSREPAALSAIGKQNNADVLLIVSCSARKLDQFGSFARMSYRCETRLLAGYTGQPLGESRFKSEPARHYDLEEMELAAKDELADQIAMYVLRRLNETGEGIVRNRLRVCGLSGVWETQSLQQLLLKQEGVEEVRLLLFERLDGGCAFFEIETSGELVDRLGALLERLPGLDLRVAAETPSWIEAEVY